MAVTKKAKEAAGERLLAAAARYVRCHGGTALVGGPIQVLTWPGDPEYKFTLAIPITGCKPTHSQKASS